jgi:drug/metabolite transporter (DMT)-like permease
MANMDWLLASSLMFVSSIVLYLLVRQSSLLKTPTQLNNLAMFIIPVFLYGIIALISGEELSITPWQAFLIVIQAIFFSYLGNVFSLKSIELSPNPGYSLVISKSYVVFTTLVALVLFNATLTLRHSLAIILIVIFSAIVMIQKKSSNSPRTSRLWLPLAFGAFFCWGMLALSSKYLYTIGVGIVERLIYSMSIVTLLILFEMRQKKIKLSQMGKEQLLILVGIGVSGATFNYFMQQGFDSAPNIGYVNAINAASIAGVTLLASKIFKDALTPKKLLGVLGVVAGLILLVT